MKRISHRLRKLEVGQTEENHDAQRMLVEVLARRDAIYWPSRSDKKFNYTQIRARRRADQAGSYGVSAKSSGRSQWGAALDTRNALIAQGLASPVRTAGGEVGGLRLTPLGEAEARGLVGLYHLDDLLPQAVLLYMRHIEVKCLAEPDLWQRELTGFSADWQHLAEPVLPLLTAGMVEAGFDMVGHVHYSLVRTDYPPVAERKSSVNESLIDIYYDAFNAEIQMLDDLEPSHDLYIPSPAFSALRNRKDQDDPQYAENRELIESLETLLGNFGPFTPRKKEA